MAVEYPPLDQAVPNPFNQDHVRAAEEALRQLSVANALIERCEKCRIPVSEARADCDGLCKFLQGFLDMARSTQSDIPMAMG